MQVADKLMGYIQYGWSSFLHNDFLLHDFVGWCCCSQTIDTMNDTGRKQLLVHVPSAEIRFTKSKIKSCLNFLEKFKYAPQASYENQFLKSIFT